MENSNDPRGSSPSSNEPSLPALATLTKWFERLTTSNKNKTDQRRHGGTSESAMDTAAPANAKDEEWIVVNMPDRERLELEKERRMNDSLREWMTSKPLSVAVTGPAESGQSRLINTLLEATSSRGSWDAPVPQLAQERGGQDEDGMDVQWFDRSEPRSALAPHIYSRSTAYSFEGESDAMVTMSTTQRLRGNSKEAVETTIHADFQITHFLSDDSDSDQSHMSIGNDPGSGDSFESLFPSSNQQAKTPNISHRRSRSTDNRSKQNPRNTASLTVAEEPSTRPKAKSIHTRPKTYRGATAYVWDQKGGKGLETIRPVENDEFDELAIDREFTMDNDFLRSIDWERESRALQAMDLGINDPLNLDQSRNFVLPQGPLVDHQPSLMFRLRYAEIPSMIVMFPTEAELRLSLWKLHEVEPLHRNSDQFLSQAFRYRKLLNLGTDAMVPLLHVNSPHELPIPFDVVAVLGKSFRFIGEGGHGLRDRVFIREKLKQVILSYAYHAPRLLIRLPCSVLANNREIIEVSAQSALSDLTSKQALANANLLMIAVDEQRGLAPEMMSALAATDMPHKLLTERNDRKAMFLRMDDPTKPPSELLGHSSQRFETEFREKLLLQFRQFVVEAVSNQDAEKAASSNPRNYSIKTLERLLQDSPVLSVNPELFTAIHLRGNIGEELMEGLSTREVLNATSIPTLLAAIPNRQLVRVSGDLHSLNRALLRNARSLQDASSSSSSSPALHAEAKVKGQQEISTFVSTFGQKIAGLKGDMPSRSDQMKILLKIKSREAAKLLVQQSEPSPNLFQYVSPIAEAAVVGYERMIAEGVAHPIRDLHQAMVDAFASVQRFIQLFEVEKTDAVLAALSRVEGSREDLSRKFTDFAHALMLGEASRFHEFVRTAVMACLKEIFDQTPTIPLSQLPNVLVKVGERLQGDMQHLFDLGLGQLVGIEREFGRLITELLHEFQGQSKVVHHQRRLKRRVSSGLLSSARNSVGSGVVYSLDAQAILQENSRPDESDSESSNSEMSLDDSRQSGESMDVDSSDVPRISADPAAELAEVPLEASILVSMLKRHELRLEPVTRDSNSQFRSLALQIYGIEGTHSIIRMLLVTEILQNHTRYERYLHLIGATSRASMVKNAGRMGLDEYCHIMSHEGCEGDQLTLLAFSHFFGVDVVLYFLDQAQPQVIQAAKAASKEPIRLAFLGDVYQPILPSDSLISSNRSSAITQAAQLDMAALPAPRKQKKVAGPALRGEGRTLVDLCVTKVAENIERYPPLAASLPADIIQKMIDSLSVMKHLALPTLLPLISPFIASNSIVLRDLVGNRVTDDMLIEIARRAKNLSRVELYNVTARGFSALISNTPNLAILVLNQCPSIAAVAFQELARKCSRLQSLDLTGCVQVSSSAMQDTCLSSAQTLVELSLAQIAQLGDAALSYLPNSLESLDLTDVEQVTSKGLGLIATRCPNLVVLKMNAKNLTEAAVIALANSCKRLRVLEIPHCLALTNPALFTLAFKCSELEVLNIEGARGIDDAAFLGIGGSDTSARLPALRSLNLSRCLNISDAGVRKLISGSPKLRTLSLNGCEGLTDNCAFAVAESLPKLQSLDLAKVAQLTDRGMAALLSRCRRLKKLVVHNCVQLTDASWSLFPEACAQLEHLDLSCCVLGESFVRLVKGCTRLSYVDLSEVSALSEEAIAHLSFLRLLASLKLSRCPGLTDRSLAAIVEACRELRELDISYCNNVSPRLLGQSDLFLRLPFLSSLNLRGYPHELTALAHPYLERLVISWCPLVDDTAVVAIASQCPNLVHVDLSYTVKITGNAVHKLVLSCPALRSLNIRGCAKISPITIQYLAGASSLLIYR